MLEAVIAIGAAYQSLGNVAASDRARSIVLDLIAHDAGQAVDGAATYVALARGTWAIEPDGRTGRYSEALERVYGIPGHRVRGELLAKLIPIAPESALHDLVQLTDANLAQLSDSPVEYLIVADDVATALIEAGLLTQARALIETALARRAQWPAIPIWPLPALEISRTALGEMTIDEVLQHPFMEPMRRVRAVANLDFEQADRLIHSADESNPDRNSCLVALARLRARHEPAASLCLLEEAAAPIGLMELGDYIETALILAGPAGPPVIDALRASASTSLQSSEASS